MGDAQRRLFHLFSQGCPEETLAVASFRGKERLSEIYRFELELVSRQAGLDLEALMENPARFVVERPVILANGARGFHPLPFHGVLCELEQHGRVAKSWYQYRATLVPRLWKLSLPKRCRIFIEKTVPEIVQDVLKDNGLSSDDVEVNTSRTYVSRDYAVQYYETDLNFIQRLCEHEGIYYYFEQGESREKLIFQDSGESYPPITGEFAIPFREGTIGEGTPENNLAADAWTRPPEIHNFVSQKSYVPMEVVLKDYNWRKPSLDLQQKQEVADRVAYGSHYEFGDHFRDSDQGSVLARIRAEELACRQSLFRGRSTARTFRAGFVFELADHFRDSLNQKYLLTEVIHEGAQHIEAVLELGPHPEYHNEFFGIPETQVFRPERKTPKPKVSGTINAKVDASGDGQYAEVDEEGRYKIVIPFDLSGKDQGKASRFIRMAQPYAGGNMGMHFPLHKGTEVLLTHTNGDPDRPIISAAVPNRETPSLITGSNQTQSTIQTGGGNQIVIEDKEGKQRIHLSTPSKKTTFIMGQS